MTDNAPFDLSLCSHDECESLIAQARERLKELDYIGRSRAREKIVAAIVAEGFMPQDIFPALARRGEEVSKYRHPRFGFLTWSGEGRPPRWYLDLLSEGYTKERLLISSQDAAPPPRPKDRRAHGHGRVVTGLFSGVAKLKMQARQRVSAAGKRTSELVNG